MLKEENRLHSKSAAAELEAAAGEPGSRKEFFTTRRAAHGLRSHRRVKERRASALSSGSQRRSDAEGFNRMEWSLRRRKLFSKGRRLSCAAFESCSTSIVPRAVSLPSLDDFGGDEAEEVLRHALPSHSLTGLSPPEPPARLLAAALPPQVPPLAKTPCPGKSLMPQGRLLHVSQRN